MSYILDALRRADAERDRSGVPALDGQAAELVDDESEPRASTPPWAWALLGAVLVGALLLLWQWLGREEPPPAVAPPTQAQAQLTAPAPEPAPVQAAPAVITPTTPPAPPPAAPPPAPAEKRVAAAPKPAVREPAVPKPPVRSAAETAFADAEGTPPQSDSKTPKLAQLPEEFRRGLPALVIAGSTYSPVPSARMLIVNGQVQREGDEPAPGVTIKQIRLRSAVFESRGQRFEVGF